MNDRLQNGGNGDPIAKYQQLANKAAELWRSTCEAIEEAEKARQGINETVISTFNNILKIKSEMKEKWGTVLPEEEKDDATKP